MGMGVGDQIFYVLACRVSVACVRIHRNFEFVPTLLFVIVVMKWNRNAQVGESKIDSLSSVKCTGSLVTYQTIWTSDYAGNSFIS